MAFPRAELQRVLDAGHPDDALVGFPISLVREILRSYPVDFVPPIATPVASQGAPA
jgi:hypothetical protein